jgi:hypothetical protein
MRKAWATIKTALLVGLVTSLIWLWAEAESLSTISASPRVEFVAGGTELYPRLVEGGLGFGGAVRLRLAGSTTAIDRAQRLLSSVVRFVPGVGAMPATTGEQTINLREALEQHPDFRKLGVTIVEADPPTVRIALDEMVTRSLPVRVAGGQGLLAGEPSPDLRTATVTFPSSALPKGTDPDTLAVVARLEEGVLDRLPDDGPRPVRARLTLPEPLAAAAAAGVPVTLSPESVTVIVRVRSRTESLTVPTVPVWVSLPPDEAGKWDVELLDPYLRDVTISGPRDAVAALRERAEGLIAFVQLGSDDLERTAGVGVTTKGVVFATAPSVLSFSGAETAVRVKVTRRSNPAGTP